MKKQIIITTLLLIAGAGFAMPKLDADGDGKISKEEYITYRMETARKDGGKKITRKSLEAAFERTDTDKDGFLTPAERKAAKKKKS